MTHRFLQALDKAELVERSGRVVRILPTYVEADGPNAPLGALCRIQTRESGNGSGRDALAEVVGVLRDTIILAPFGDRPATFSGARVVACGGADTAPVGDALLGRALNALGAPIDNLGPLASTARAPLNPTPVPPLERASPNAVLETGVRAIDGLLTLGRGQRVGVFAASGVGKTTLMTQLANQVGADHCVICLVGERGREVEALWSRALSPAVRARSTLIAATSDDSAAMRARAADYALAVADHWRAAGRHVLLLVDSVTRLAMALREIGLAAGEPPTVRAYTPSVFATIPKLVERCGSLRSGGAITAIMTVLCETDETDDPVAEMMKSLLDGHLILSRDLAEQGRYPAIDAPRSISRLASDLLDAEGQNQAQQALALLSAYDASRTLIESGLYVRGASPEIDRALDRRPGLVSYLRQASSEHTPYAAARAALARALSGEAV